MTTNNQLNKLETKLKKLEVKLEDYKEGRSFPLMMKIIPLIVSSLSSIIATFALMLGVDLFKGENTYEYWGIIGTLILILIIFLLLPSRKGIIKFRIKRIKKKINRMKAVANNA